MGKIAQKYSNHVILTNDNPRDEDEMDIINDILSEVKEMEKISINLESKGCNRIIYLGNGKKPYKRCFINSRKGS